MFQSSLFNFNREYYTKQQNKTKPRQNQQLMGMPVDFSIPITLVDDFDKEMNENSSFYSLNRQFGLSNNAFEHLHNTLTHPTQYPSNKMTLDSPNTSPASSSTSMPQHMIQERVETSLPKHYSIHIELDHDQHSSMENQCTNTQQTHHQQGGNQRFVSQEEFFQQVYARYQSTDSDALSNNSYQSSTSSSNSNHTNNQQSNQDGQDVATSIFSSFSFWG